METKRKKLLEEELIRLVKRWRNIGHQLLPDIQRSLINEAQSSVFMFYCFIIITIISLYICIVYLVNKEILQNQGYYLELITKLKIKDLRSKQVYIFLFILFTILHILFWFCRNRNKLLQN